MSRRTKRAADPRPPVLSAAAIQRQRSEMLAREFLATCFAHGLATPMREFMFAKHLGREWRFDFAWPADQIALEVEGGVWTNGRHTRGSGFVRDMEKYNRAGVLGWIVLRVTPDTLCADKTMLMLREALDSEPL